MCKRQLEKILHEVDYLVPFQPGPGMGDILVTQVDDIMGHDRASTLLISIEFLAASIDYGILLRENWMMQVPTMVSFFSICTVQTIC